MSHTGAEVGQADWRELVAVVLLSMSALVTAWSGFQAGKWGGEMSIAFSQASSARIEAARLDGVANRKLSTQASLFTQWLEAYQARDDDLTSFLEARFPEPLRSSFEGWLASRPLKNPDAPATPFDTPDYVIPETQAAQAADARATERFDTALRHNQVGDNYTLVTVAFAMVLFLTALSGRVRQPRARTALLAFAVAVFLVASGFLIAFPKLV